MPIQSLVIANWKMNLTPRESAALASEFLTGWGGPFLSAPPLSPRSRGGEMHSEKGLPIPSETLVAIAPAFTALESVNRALVGSPILLAAQDVFWEEKGAYTGAVSVRDLKELGCQWVLVGHSERRHVFGDSSAVVGQKAKAVLSSALRPVLCVGETLAERKAGRTEAVVLEQLSVALQALSSFENEKIAQALVVAYEPVWAIGTGVTAKPEDAEAVHRVLRAALKGRLGEFGGDIPILYGGSVSPDNAGDLMRSGDIQGLLVGGASLKAKSLLKIVEIVEEFGQ